MRSKPINLNQSRARIESIEARLMLAATPLTISDTTGNNTFYLREDANHLNIDVWNDAAAAGSGTPTQTALIAQVSTVTVNGGGVNDKLTLDFSNGDPFASSVAFTGGSGANNLIITGTNGTAVSVNATTVTFASTTITYASTQTITINGGSANDTLTQTAQPAAAIVFNGGAGSDTLNINAGAYIFSGDPAATTSNLTVNDNSTLFFAGAAAGVGVNARNLAALNIGANATATVDSPASSAADRAVLILGALSINSTGKLDLSTNDLIVHKGNLALTTAQIILGYANGSWKGAAGLTSSAIVAMKGMALGDALNAVGTTGTLDATFDGQPVVRTDLLVKFTMIGDANLDGRTDGSDYTLIDNGFNSQFGKTPLTGWLNGDFNGDGKIDGSDYTLIDNAFNTQAGGSVDPLVYKLENALDVAEQQSVKTISEIGSSSNYPQYTNPNGTWSWVPATHWTAGFLPGTLWQLYQATGAPYDLTQATRFTNPLSVDEKDTSDVGFQVYDSFYPLLQQQPGNASIIQILLAAAASKATQYNATVGAFKAWRTSTSGNPAANFDVLMDLIMDSNLLFWAAQNTTGTLSQTYYNEAVQNAVTEETYLVRSDGGSAQFAYFNSATGKFVDNETYEGYSATSTWSRGEAWAIYGFTLCAQQTGRSDFLTTAEKTANYFIANLPSDYIPYWDFNVPGIPNAYRDTSAAAVAAAGLLNLSKLIAGSDPTNSARYRAAAADILASLTSSTYMNTGTTAANGLLLQGALNVPANPSVGPDSSIIFGDYYFLEALNSYVAG